MPNTTETQRTIDLPKWLCDAIENYLDTDWTDGRDPSGLGGMNAVSHIGEHIAAIYNVTRDAKAVR